MHHHASATASGTVSAVNRLITASHSTYYAFGSIHFTAMGYTPLSVSILWAIGVMAEVVFFIAPDRITLALGS